jgi:biopolymer transport protein ExbB
MHNTRSLGSGICRIAQLTALAAAFLPFAAHAEDTWWNKEWTTRRKITIDTTSAGADAAEAPTGMPVLVRLHDGAFNFAAAQAGGEDLRFLAADHKTVLHHYTERFDALLLNQGYVWVSVPDIKPNAKNEIWLYYGNATPTASQTSDPRAVLDKTTTLNWHFADGTAIDSSANELNGSGAATPVEGSLMAGGIKMDGNTSIAIPQASAWAWPTGGTFSLWVKADAPQTSIVFSRGTGQNSVVLGFDNGVPYVTVEGQKAAAAAPLATAAWKHLGVTSSGGETKLYIDGEPAATVPAGFPAIDTAGVLGKADGKQGFVGEIDEFRVANVARSAAAMRFEAAMESPERSAAVIQLGADEVGGGGWINSKDTSAVLVRSLTADGWVVICICAIMAVMSWWIMTTKVRYLNGLSRGNDVFMDNWKRISRDMTALDGADSEKIKTLGGKADDAAVQEMRKSSVYRIYHIGAEEIRHRLEVDRSKGLSARSMESIKASMDGGMVRESQRMNRLVVLLTICISGGPFLGLLGTVIGVMITFAAIAAAGDVNVNSIAPGIAGALLATVAGLAVAIPALFGYNYILSRIKDATADMNVFIDEFITRMAEYYPDSDPNASH